ncbi:DUF2793 domain-containing protein [Pseudorhodobacter sp.]|uniref:DUF2793 domain-containing protein n=1 Tax=Pseudorhodobacter sp. TaxID=1934400 RepID=UPI002AFDCCF1|nr:DUF2793 domain-containing protein [Pseudorhodobacter sp.]
MADTTTNLLLPFILAAQAQKHVTHNESLRLLDGLIQLSVLDRNLATPPGSPAEGARYIVATGATGAWSGWAGDIALWSDGAWVRLPARTGWVVWVQDESRVVVRIGSVWTPLDEAMGLLAQAGSVDVALGALGGTTGMAVLEQTLSGLSGASVTSTIEIPDRAIVLGVSTRTVTTITGATSYDCGISGETTKFGGSLGVAAGSTNVGVIGPQAFYADTPIVLTAQGGNFTGGSVRIAIHYLTLGVPN